MPRWPFCGRADTALTGTSTLGQPESGIRNITEWAKKRACWSSVIRQEVEYGPALKDHLIDPQEFRAAERDGRRAAAEISGIEAQAKVIELGGDFWERLRVWAAPNRVFSLKDDGIPRACSQQERRLPSERFTCRRYLGSRSGRRLS